MLLLKIGQTIKVKRKIKRKVIIKGDILTLKLADNYIIIVEYLCLSRRRIYVYPIPVLLTEVSTEKTSDEE